MKVAIIAPTYLPSLRANTIQVMKMSQAFVAANNEVRLAVPEESTKEPATDRSWESLAEQYGLRERFPIEWIPASSAGKKYDYAWRAVTWAGKWQAEIIYTRLPQAAALATFRDHKTILEIHDYPQGRMGPILFRAFLKGRGAKVLVVISSALASDLQKDFGSPEIQLPLIIIPDGVDLDRYKDIPEPRTARLELINGTAWLNGENKASFQVERFTAGYTGHIYPGRGVSLIIEIARYLPGMNFLIVGGNPADVERYRSIVAKSQLDNVFLTGFIPNSELPRIQAACDVLLMPYQKRVSASSGGDISRYLSPMKLFEYLACGRAICSSDLPVFREVLSSETAILLPPDDAPAWVETLKDLSDHPSEWKKFADNAKKTAGNYSWENRVRKMLTALA